MKVTLRNNKGFSLVELMVVVAIIGILAAIAVPNYQRFTAKSKQAEAKANLSAIYSAERAFQAEWNTFHTRFQWIGYAPTGTLRYQHGFGADFATVPLGFNAPAGVDFSTLTYCAQGAAPNANGCAVSILPVPPGVIPAAATVPAAGNTFLAHARGDIDGDAVVDIWTINQMKTLTNTGAELN